MNPHSRAPLVLALLLAVAPVCAGDPTPAPGGWTLVSIPDTQNYVRTSAGTAIFGEETQWIADNAAAWNIRFVTHVGDLVDDNGNLLIQGYSVPGMAYSVQSNGGLFPSVWTHENSHLATEAMSQALVPIAGSRRFYRIVVD